MPFVINQLSFELTWHIVYDNLRSKSQTGNHYRDFFGKRPGYSRVSM
ncbi:hypothetical protein HMPREF0574_1187 [Mobiluncus curtisii subsp. curtisii ATCC 35241]|uniref:Uncharacterized protein n=1 Tax=Mobiluncus holmesii ATCC 35242 TaxID=887899 RepID=E6M5J7_9ACTO|nr:hypothetical protein HMPREF0574_1187 [Mobiluncus curtisii subsp. curtisii ATCC 35241]EFU81745.1 hypothetical protein HMPREF0576_1587 [Mobiluncus holmesii ATCC 35242]